MSNWMQAAYVAASGGLSQEKRMDVTSNNLANVNTVGYKKDGPTFESYLAPKGTDNKGSPYSNMDMTKTYYTDNLANQNNKVYTIIDRIYTDHTKGPIRQTGEALDFSIDGDGFFNIATTNGVRFSRSGTFSLNAAGNLVTPDGNLVLGEDAAGNTAPIVIRGSEKPRVSNNGTIFVNKQSVGKIKITHFNDFDKLRKIGYSLYANDGGQPNLATTKTSTVQQGYLEQSNVNVVREMVNMIDLMRAYESSQRVITSIDSLNQKASTLGNLG